MRPDMLQIRPAHRLTNQQIAAVGIAHRERIDAGAVAGEKPTLEVDAPDVVRSLAGGKRLAIGRRTPAPPARHDQIRARENVADRARRRPDDGGLPVGKPGPDLLRPPARMRPPHRDHPLAGRTPMAVWREGVTDALAGNAVDMTLRLDDAAASPTCPPRQQQQQTPRWA